MPPATLRSAAACRPSPPPRMAEDVDEERCSAHGGRWGGRGSPTAGPGARAHRPSGRSTLRQTAGAQELAAGRAVAAFDAPGAAAAQSRGGGAALPRGGARRGCGAAVHRTLWQRASLDADTRAALDRFHNRIEEPRANRRPRGLEYASSFIG